MPTQPHLAKVSELIDVSKIPGNFEALESFAQDGVDFLLGKIFYKEFAADNSANSDTAYYRLVIVTKSLRLPLFGTDMNLVFFRESDIDFSEFPLVFDVTWPIKKYISNFDIQGFSYLPEALLDIFLELTNLEQKDFLGQIVNEFLNLGDGAHIDFLNDLKANISALSDGSPAADSEMLNISNQLDIIRDEVEDSLTAGNLFSAAEIFRNFEDYAVYANAVDSIKTSLDILGDDLDIEVNLFKEIILNAVSGITNVNELIQRLTDLFKTWLKDITAEQIKELLIPQFRVELQGIKMALEFPRNWLVPLIEDLPTNPGIFIEDPDLNKQSALEFTIGSLQYSTKTGFQFEDQSSWDFQRSQIGNTGFQLEFHGMKVDLSRTTNIPEATADGRPVDFIGVFIQDATVQLPALFGQSASNAVIKGRNLLVGTGGISGTIGIEAVSPGDPDPPLIEGCFGSGGFCISLDAVDMTFHQNAIIESNIHGSMTIPGFVDSVGDPANINIDVFIGQEGDFSVTASEDQGIDALVIDGILAIRINSLAIGREDDRFYLELSGGVTFEDLQGAIGQFIPEEIAIQKLRIWEDGKIELQGGKVTLPKAVSLKIGPVALSVTAVGLGSHEQEYGSHLRQYKYFTFDGGISVKPGGVEASGNGIALYWTTDNNTTVASGHPDYRPLNFFIRIESIAIDIIIPGNAKPADATLLLNGFLSMQDTPNGTEYIGGVDFTLPKLKMGGSAAMRMNPKVPAFLIDIELNMANPILLGSTGLGIYGFRAILGQRYVASKTAAGIDEADPWWQYYKSKVNVPNKEGINVGKFSQEDGFSLGAGVSLATTTDAGKAFSSKLMFLLSLPDVFLLQGQAQILKERIGLDSTVEPPFYALIAITNQSVEANYKIPDVAEGGQKPGGIATVDALIEMGFFFGNSGGWYINLGKDSPDNRRIQVRLLDMIDAYFYLMLSGSGIRAGAGASYELNKKFGPLRAELSAYMDVAGRIAFKPKQIGQVKACWIAPREPYHNNHSYLKCLDESDPFDNICLD
jgi:hypothetical protein